MSSHLLMLRYHLIEKRVDAAKHFQTAPSASLAPKAIRFTISFVYLSQAFITALNGRCRL